MIQIQITTALALYGAVIGLLIVCIWLYTEFFVHRTTRTLEKQSLWQCVFCGYTYLDEGAQELSQCPRCASFNSATDKHARFVPSRARQSEEDEPSADVEPRHPNPSRRKRPHQRRRGPRRH
jgi:hypothetical protein